MNSLLHVLSRCGSEVHSVLSSRAGLSAFACSLNRRSTTTRPRLSLFPLRGMILIFDDYMPRDIIVNRGEQNDYQDSFDSIAWICLACGLYIACCTCDSHSVPVYCPDPNAIYPEYDSRRADTYTRCPDRSS